MLLQSARSIAVGSRAYATQIPTAFNALASQLSGVSFEISTRMWAFLGRETICVRLVNWLGWAGLGLGNNMIIILIMIKQVCRRHALMGADERARPAEVESYSRHINEKNASRIHKARDQAMAIESLREENGRKFAAFEFDYEVKNMWFLCSQSDTIDWVLIITRYHHNALLTTMLFMYFTP